MRIYHYKANYLIIQHLTEYPRKNPHKRTVASQLSYSKEVYSSSLPFLTGVPKEVISYQIQHIQCVQMLFQYLCPWKRSTEDCNHPITMLVVTCSFFLKCRMMVIFMLIKMRLSDLSLNGHKTSILIITRKICLCLPTPSSKQSYQFLIFMHLNFSIMKSLFPLILHTQLYYAQEEAYVNIISMLPFLFILLLIRTQRSALIFLAVPQELYRQKLINKGLFYKIHTPRNKAAQALSQIGLHWRSLLKDLGCWCKNFLW